MYAWTVISSSGAGRQVHDGWRVALFYCGERPQDTLARALVSFSGPPAAGARGRGVPALGGRKLGAVGEFGLIAALTDGLRRGPDVLLGPGDDCAVLAARDGRVVVSTDTLVADRHFRLGRITATDLGHKAAAVAMADVAAMGAVPTGVLAALCLPEETEVDWVLDLVRGIEAEAAVAGACVVGGDVVRGPQVVLTLTVLGDLQGRAPLTRSGARPGHVVAVAGSLGRSAAGLAVQESGRGADWPDLLATHHRPRPPYGSGPAAAALGATSLIDVSDGLLADLAHVALASGVAIDLHGAAFVPDARLAAAAAAFDADAVGWMLTGGEDHALVATFPATAPLPAGWQVVGAVSDGPVAVTVDGRSWAGRPGWDHFAGPDLTEGQA
jgi:thiamine-monophosphate kinase